MNEHANTAWSPTRKPLVGLESREPLCAESLSILAVVEIRTDRRSKSQRDVQTCQLENGIILVLNDVGYFPALNTDTLPSTASKTQHPSLICHH